MIVVMVVRLPGQRLIEHGEADEGDEAVGDDLDQRGAAEHLELADPKHEGEGADHDYGGEHLDERYDRAEDDAVEEALAPRHEVGGDHHFAMARPDGMKH